MSAFRPPTEVFPDLALTEFAPKPSKEESFATDNAAKAHIRDMVRKNYALKVRSSPGEKPVREMGHAEALQWAHD